MRSRLLFPLCSFLFSLAACGKETGGARGSGAVRDSAGIRIVENGAPLWAEGKGWTVVDSPLVDIGGKAGDPAYDLSQITGVLPLRDGRVAVAVGGAYQVRFFDAKGNHLATSGQRGSGPGEYQGIAGMWRAAGDSVLVSDLVLRRLTLLSDSGKVVRSFSLGGAAGLTMQPGASRVSFAIPAGAFGDGSILGLRQAFRVNDSRQGSYRDSATYIVYGADGAVRDSVGRFPGIEMEQVTMTFGKQTFNSPSPVALGRTTVAVALPHGFLVAMNNAWEIEVRGPKGELQRLIRIRAEPRPITAEDQAEHRRLSKEALDEQPMLRGMPPEIKQQILDRVDRAVYPKTFPFIASLLAATDGTLWVYEQAKPGLERRVMTVFDSTGRLQGRVTMPDKFQPTFVGDDVVAGIWKDLEEVEHARVYRIRKQ